MTELATRITEELLYVLNTNKDVQKQIEDKHWDISDELPLQKIPYYFFEHHYDMPSEIELPSGTLKFVAEAGSFADSHPVYIEYELGGHLFVAFAYYNSWDSSDWTDEFIEVRRVDNKIIPSGYEEIQD